jgi:glycosyltransferase involved in cell wall biosynthesis
LHVEDITIMSRRVGPNFNFGLPLESALPRLDRASRLENHRLLMRILHLTDRASVRGGAYWHLRSILDCSSEHELLVAAGRRETDARLPCPVVIVPGLDSRDRGRIALDDLTSSFKPDVIHLHTIMSPAALEWAAGRASVITVQDHRFFCPGRGKWTASNRRCAEPMTSALCAACFSDADYAERILRLTEERLAAVRRMTVVVLSRYMKRELSLVGVPPDRIHVIPPFVHGLKRDVAPDGPTCVLFVGRLVESKGALDAARTWRLAGIDLPLVAAGTGPLRSPLAEMGADVLGWLPHEKLSALYRRAKALLLPSRWQEPFGIAGLEALTMGVPVAAWDSGGVREWHQDDLTTWGDHDALARVLRSALGRRAVAPSGFEREPLMERLTALYRVTAGSRRISSVT